jgi:hypothetical protein
LKSQCQRRDHGDTATTKTKNAMTRIVSQRVVYEVGRPVV